MNVWRRRRRAGSVRWTAMALGVLLAALAAWAPVALAQDADDVKAMLNRMERLERDIRTLNMQLNRGAPPPVPASAPTTPPPPAVKTSASGGAGGGGPALARLSVRLSALESDLRTATGAMEELGFRLGEVVKRLDKLVADVDFRLGALEKGVAGAGVGAKPPGPPRLSAAPSPPPVQRVIPGQGGDFATPPATLGTVSQNAVSALNPPGKEGAAAAAAKAAAKAAARPPPVPAPAAAATTAPSILPKGTPKDQYDYAFGLLRQANYDQAELALREFVDLHPKEPLASNARYWLGETYYVRAAYVQAAEVFLEGYQADPKGPKAPDSLLKLGMSLAGLDKNREACAAFKKLLKDFPTVSAGVKNTVQREKQKNGCS